MLSLVLQWKKKYIFNTNIVPNMIYVTYNSIFFYCEEDIEYLQT